MINPLQDFVGGQHGYGCFNGTRRTSGSEDSTGLDGQDFGHASAVYRELLQTSNHAKATRPELRCSTRNNGVVTQVLYRNNGLVFGPQDWARLRKIAQGNPNPSKVGAFGAYPMFRMTPFDTIRLVSFSPFSEHILDKRITSRQQLRPPCGDSSGSRQEYGKGCLGRWSNDFSIGLVDLDGRCSQTIGQ